MEEIERRFGQRMRAELAANRHKPDWRYMTLWEARAELKHHQKKLDKAVLAGDAPAIKEYAADVANCAMFVAWAAGVLAEEDDSPGNRVRCLQRWHTARTVVADRAVPLMTYG